MPLTVHREARYLLNPRVKFRVQERGAKILESQLQRTHDSRQRGVEAGRLESAIQGTGSALSQCRGRLANYQAEVVPEGTGDGPCELDAIDDFGTYDVNRPPALSSVRRTAARATSGP